MRKRWRIGVGACAALMVVASAAPPAAADAATPALPQVASALVNPSECAPTSDTMVDQEPWTESALGLPEARTHADGTGTTVAIVGSGVGDSAAALDGAVSGDALGAGDDCVGYSTFLAGVVAARPQPDSGLIGVAPGAKIRSYETTDDLGHSAPDENAKGITSAVSDGARVVLVVSGYGEGSAALEASVAAAAEADALIVAPAADYVQTPASPSFPAAYDGVMGVVATGPDGAPINGEAPPDPEGVHSVPDLAAPGSAVMSLAPGGDGHAVAEGHAVAAAFVAGTAALVRSHDPDLSAAQTAERLTTTAYPASGRGLGAGTVDPVGALSRTLGPASGGNAPDDGFTLVPPPVLTEGRTLAVVGGVALLVLIFGVAAAGVRRRKAASAA